MFKMCPQPSGMFAWLAALWIGMGCAPTDAVRADTAVDEDALASVYVDATYEVDVTTHVYGRGLFHDYFGGAPLGSMALELDVWEPRDAPPGRPAVVLIHGGGFTGGSRHDRVDFASFLSERGFVVLNIDYRLAGDVGTVPDDWFRLVVGLDLPAADERQAMAIYPAARDAKAAVRWLHANAETYAIDTDRVTAIGGSAGASLAIMLGVTDEADFRDELSTAQDSSLLTTNLDAAADVHTIIDHWGGGTLLEMLEEFDGQPRFDGLDAPISIVHGTDDPTVSFEQAELLREAYIETGVPHAFYPLDGAGHGAWNQTVDGMSLPALSLAFIAEQQELVVIEDQD